MYKKKLFNKTKINKIFQKYFNKNLQKHKLKKIFQKLTKN